MNINSTALNIIRVYATLLVFLCHSTIIAKESFGFIIQESIPLRMLFLTPAWGGVWIFLVVGGFLAAYGFDTGKYTLDKSGILKYYRGRILKVLIPTYIFISLMYIFNMLESHVEFTTILKWLTCTFNGHDAGIKRVGASWYVFIIMWLYLMSPFLLKLLYKFEIKYRKREFKAYIYLIGLVFVFGISYRLGGVILDKMLGAEGKIYYNWFYANVTGCFDMFLIGVIGERLLRFMPPINEERFKKCRILSFFALLLTAFVFVGMFKYQRTLYRFIGPCLFSLSTIIIIISTSVKINSDVLKLNSKFERICNLIAPYAFMFYLWHSPLLGYVADKIEIENLNLHYFSTLVVGGMVTVYVAFLMTKMNNGIIKTLQ